VVPEQSVHLFDADPDLGDALDDASRRIAHRYAVARLAHVAPGAWAAEAEWTAADEILGLLVLDGLLTRDVHVGRRTASELLGSGDILRPWERFDEELEGRPAVWRAHEPVRMAILDRRLLLVAAEWPAFGDALFQRMTRRSRALAVNLAINQVTGIDRRLLFLFWDAARRWGRVTPEGVRVRLPLTHQTLGQIVGASRPSVSLGLGELADRGELRREGDEWVLRNDPHWRDRTPVAEALREGGERLRAAG
jgi:CRP/FNR family transcriptional regulator, cyclic AMP receptor protein